MKESVRRLLILGTRTFAVEVADVASEIAGVELAGFVENMKQDLCGDKLDGLPVYWVNDIAKFAQTHSAVCALATTQRSRFIEQVKAFNIPFASLVHPSAQISAKSSFEEGTIISRGVIIATDTHLGKHVIINRGVLIGHHTKIGNYVTIQPGANMAGACSIGDSTYIGMGAVILDHISIGSHSVIGAGAVVTHDVPDNVQVIGVPARITKENIEGK